MLDAVLFDLDGTLSDPLEGITGAFRHAVEAHGMPADADADLRWIIGPAVRHNFERYGLPEDLHDEAVRTFRARMLEVGLYQAVLIEGITDVLSSLRADGLPLAVATAKPTAQAEINLAHLGLLEHFDAVAGGVADGVPRSKALIVADALEALGGPDPARVAMVGDRVHDVDGARGNGCIAVAVTWGFAELGEHDACAPDHVVATPAELLACLRAL